MADRYFEEMYWSADFPLIFGLRVRQGQRVESLSLAGDPLDPEAACIWRRDLVDPPEQEVSGFYTTEGLLSELSLRLPEGWGPAMLSGVRRGGTNRYAVVWERVPAGAPPPQLCIDDDFVTFRTRLGSRFECPRTLCIRAIGVIPRGNTAATYVATLWPQSALRMACGVSHMLAVAMEEHTIHHRGEAKAWGNLGTPWQVLPHRIGVGGGDSVQGVLALWRDVHFASWGGPPFAIDDLRYMRTIKCLPNATKQNFLDERDRLEGSGFELLHAGTAGNGGTKRYSGLWIPKGAEPLPRTFLRNGIGNGRNGVDAPPRVRGTQASPRLARSLGRVPGPSFSRDPEVEVERGRPDDPVDWRAGRSTEEAPTLEDPAAFDRRPTPGDPRGDLAELRSAWGQAAEDLEARGGDWGIPRGQPTGDGDTPQSGGPAAGSFGAPTAPSLAESNLHPFDTVMSMLMHTYGLRGGQLASLRRRKLGFVRAYTFAEEGYIVTKGSHRMRWGSVPKAFTAVGVATHYMGLDPGDPMTGLETKLVDALGIDRTQGMPGGDPGFEAIKVISALRHFTGVQEKKMDLHEVYRLVHGAPPGDDYRRVMADLEPGDMSVALARWATPLVTTGRHLGGYNNLIYVALAELWAKLRTSDRDEYLEAVRAQLPSALKDRSPLTGATQAECLARNEVAYHGGFLSIDTSPHYQDLVWVPEPYRGCPQFGTGAGWWALSALEMAQVMRQFSDGSNDTWPNVAGKVFIHDEDIIPAAWTHFKFSDSTSSSGTTIFRVIWHNGEGYGASAVVIHMFRPSDPDDTIDIVVAFNGEGPASELLEVFMELLLDAAKQTEERGLWADGDLFALA